MAALSAIAAHVADIPGRKNLLWLTANLPFSGQEIARILSRANIAAYPLDARGLLSRESLTSSEADVMDADDYALRKALGTMPAAGESSRAYWHRYDAGNGRRDRRPRFRQHQ